MFMNCGFSPIPSGCPGKHGGRQTGWSLHSRPSKSLPPTHRKFFKEPDRYRATTSLFLVNKSPTFLGHGDKVGDVMLAGGGRAPVDLEVPGLEDLLYLVLAQGLLQVAGDELLLLSRAELAFSGDHHDGGQQAA